MFISATTLSDRWQQTRVAASMLSRLCRLCVTASFCAATAFAMVSFLVASHLWLVIYVNVLMPFWFWYAMPWTWQNGGALGDIDSKHGAGRTPHTLRAQRRAAPRVGRSGALLASR